MNAELWRDRMHGTTGSWVRRSNRLSYGPESTIYGAFWKPEQERLGVTGDLVRLSLGIEHIEDILADLDQALRAV